jgi:uncharacterized protein (TIGR03492 family)
VKRLLVVSNGYGEDLEVTQVIRAFPAHDVGVTVYPLVGMGRAFPPDVTLLTPRREFPSGGFGVRAGWHALWADLRSGWLGFWAAQRRTLRAQRGKVDLVVAAGDVYCLWMASCAGGPTAYLALPRSEYITPHSPLELRTIKRIARQVFTRDKVTADALRRHGIPAQYRGFPLMDTLAPTGETFGFPAGRPVLTLLPGSKPPAFENLILLLRAAVAAAARTAPIPAVLVAWAPNLSRDRLRETVLAMGGRWMDEGRFHLDASPASGGAPDPRGSLRAPIEVTVTTDHFADALMRATVVIGMAGAAHEQAAGLGKPIVAFPGVGPQFTARFLQEQKKLLGDALAVTRTEEEAARAVVTLLADPAERERRGRAGRERQGGPGGAAAIAHDLLASLDAGERAS